MTSPTADDGDENANDGDVRRWHTIAVTKIPAAERDMAAALFADGRPFYDCIGADTPDDDPRFPVGSPCLYAVELTDAEAAEVAEQSNVRAVELDLATDPHTAPIPLPADATLRYLRAAVALVGGDWHGRDQTVAVLDQGTTQAVRNRMGCTLVGRTNVGDPVPAGQELHAATDGRASGFHDHGCLVAPNAVPAGGRLLDVLIVQTDGRSSVSMFAAGVRYAVDQGVRIINYSFGAQGSGSQGYADALTYARDAGAEVFISAGNDDGAALSSPALYSRTFANVHSVIAFDERNNARAAFSNRATDASGCAPGVGIISLTPTAEVKSWNGTSAASPLAASACARGATGGRFTARQVGAALKANLRDTGQPATEQGRGAYDLRRTLVALGALSASPTRRNRHPKPSAELDVAGWAAGPTAPVTMTTTVRTSEVASPHGSWHGATTLGGDGTGTVRFYGPPLDVAAGETVTVSVSMRRNRPQTATSRVYLRWYSEPGATGTDFGVTDAPAVPFPGADTWHRLSNPTVVPAGAQSAWPYVYAVTPGAFPNAAGPDVMRVDGWLVESGDLVEPYFDGATPGAAWDGAAYASESQLNSGVAASGVGRLRVSGAAPGADGSSTYAGQAFAYTHNSVIRGEQVSTILPTDVIRIGSTLYLHVMAVNGLGNNRFQEIYRSTDNGQTWQTTNATWPGTVFGGLFQLPTFCDGGDGYIYALSTGFQRDRGLAMFRVPVAGFTDVAAWRMWTGTAWAATGTPAIVVAGAFGEMNLRRIADRWVLAGFDAGLYAITARVLPAGASLATMGTAPTKAIVRGVGWENEDHSRGLAAQIYGGSIIPGSTLADLHLVVSQWNTGTNAIYKAMQFRANVSDLA